MLPLNILSLFDVSGIMVRPWLEAGHRCTIVDLQHPPGAHAEGSLARVGADLRTWRPAPFQRWDFVIAFPPCTDLAASGARWWASKGPARLRAALGLVARARRLIYLSGASCWALENPVGRLATHWRKPDHSFDPCDFGGYLPAGGDAYTKRTCLWVGPGFIMPATRRVAPTEGSKMHRMSSTWAKQRSVTPAGFAHAVYEANAPALSARLALEMGE